MSVDAPRNWDVFVEIQAEKIAARTQQELAEYLAACRAVALEIGARLELMLNNLSHVEVRNGIPTHVVRNDAKQREWEACFSAVNMGAPQIVALICRGYYLQAIALIRQELEGLAQLHHILHNTRTDKRAPGLKHLDEDVRRVYNMLSTGAHIGTHEMASVQAPAYADKELIAVLPHGVSILPGYNGPVARELFDIHTQNRRMICADLDEHLGRNNIEPVRAADSEAGLNA